MGTPCLWQYESLSFLKCVVIFTLKWISLLSCPMTLSLIYSPSLLPPKSSVEGFASWSDMVTVASSGVFAHQRPRVGRTSLRGLQILSLPDSTTRRLARYCFKTGQNCHWGDATLGLGGKILWGKQAMFKYIKVCYYFHEIHITKFIILTIFECKIQWH